MSEWQPIETAPTKTQILLGFFYGDSPGYDKDGDAYCQIGRITFHGTSDVMKTMASVTCGAPDNHCVSLGCELLPTHWQPLPEPPKAGR